MRIIIECDPGTSGRVMANAVMAKVRSTIPSLDPEDIVIAVRATPRYAVPQPVKPDQRAGQ